MLFKCIFISGIVFILLTGITSAATVSIDSYRKSCTQCSFDSSGKMDEKCWQDIQGGAKVDLAMAYPAMSFKYQWGGGCPQLDQCISALQTCKSLYTSGNDETDCMHNRLTHCFVAADACAEAANQVCTEGKSEEEAGLKDALKNMTTKKNITKEEVEDIVIDEGGILDCLFPDFILLSALAGALFYSRKQ